MRLIARAMKELTPAERKAVEFQLSKDPTEKELAEFLDCKLGAAKMAKSRGMKRLIETVQQSISTGTDSDANIGA